MNEALIVTHTIWSTISVVSSGSGTKTTCVRRISSSLAISCVACLFWSALLAAHFSGWTPPVIIVFVSIVGQIWSLVLLLFPGIRNVMLDGL